MKNSKSDRRLEENQAFFRQNNEKVFKGFEELKRIAREENQPIPTEPEALPLLFYCECSNEKCRRRILLLAGDYAKIHEDRACFSILPGHEIKDIEEVVAKRSNCYVVKKYRTPPSKVPKLHTTDLKIA